MQSPGKRYSLLDGAPLSGHASKLRSVVNTKLCGLLRSLQCQELQDTLQETTEKTSVVESELRQVTANGCAASSNITDLSAWPLACLLLPLCDICLAASNSHCSALPPKVMC